MQPRQVLLALCALPFLAFGPWSGRAPYADGPPPAHTGGFGEPSCRACHFDNPLNEPSGSLTVSGMPDRFSPGDSYRITVALTRPGMQRAGFQLAIRYAAGARAGTPAGVLLAGDSRVAVAAAPSGVPYAQHTIVGATLAGTDSAEWTVEWRAPARAGTVSLHVAANAANGDQSEFGDHIYVRGVTAAPRRQVEK